MFFWELFEVLSWFEGTILQEKEEQVLRFSFHQLIIEDFWSITGPKIVLKHLSMNDIGYPFFKTLSFRNANSLYIYICIICIYIYIYIYIWCKHWFITYIDFMSFYVDHCHWEVFFRVFDKPYHRELSCY